MSKKILESPKYAKKRRKKIIGTIVIFSILVVALVMATVLLLRASFLQISTIDIDSTVTTSQISINNRDLIRQKVSKNLEGDYLYVIPKTNILFFPKKMIKEDILNSMYEISDVDIDRSGLSSIDIKIKERIPTALVCSGFHEENVDNDKCYLADENAFVFEDASSKTASSTNNITDKNNSTENPYNSIKNNRYYIPADNDDVRPGSVFIDAGRFRDLQKFISGALKGGISPLGVLIADDGEYEMYIKNPTSKVSPQASTEATVYFNSQTSLDTTLSNLLTFWQNNIEKSSSTTMKSFDSINLRFGNAVYYSNNER